MSKSKHTPGPWYVLDHGNGIQDITARESDGFKCRPARIYGDALDEVYGPVAIANARLIAAAPDLLHACKVIISAERDWQGKCAAAIARAELLLSQGLDTG